MAEQGAAIAAGYWRHGEPAEKFLATTYITGQIWAVNGGMDM